MNYLLHLFYQAPLMMSVFLAAFVLSIMFVAYTARTILYTPRCTDYGSAEWVVWSEVFRVNLHSFLLVNAVWFGLLIWGLCYLIPLIGNK